MEECFLIKMKTLLIVSGGIEAVPGIQHAVNMGLKVIVSDGDSNAVGFRSAHQKIVASTYDAEATLKGVLEYERLYGKIDGVICIAADVPLTVATLVQHLGLKGISVATAKLSMDKLSMKECFRGAGIPIPWFKEIVSVDDLRKTITSVNFNLIIKPIDSRGARGVLQLGEQTDLFWAYSQAKENSPSGRVMVEEFLEGFQVSTESIIVGERASTPGFSDRNYEHLERFRPYVIENGGEQPTQLHELERQAVSDLAVKAARAMGIQYGTAKGDMILTKDGPKIIEMAARLSGGWLATNQITLATGINLVEIAIKLALGEPVELPEPYPLIRQGVAIRYFFPVAGRVFSINDQNQMLSQEWVSKYDIYVKEGDMIEPVTNHTKRAGYVITVGQNRDEAVQRAELVTQSVEIKTQ